MRIESPPSGLCVPFIAEYEFATERPACQADDPTCRAFSARTGDLPQIAVLSAPGHGSSLRHGAKIGSLSRFDEVVDVA